MTETVGQVSTTHHIEIAGDRVVKTFVSWDRGEHRREWRGLTLLHEHAPGLGPEPISADLDAHPPVIVMGRVPGESLGTRRATPEQIDALVFALDRLHFAVPAHVLADVDPHDTPSRIADLLRRMIADRATPSVHGGSVPVVCEAFEAAHRFIDSNWVERGVRLGEPMPVFGTNDGNLANYLWDPEKRAVRVVDFESAGSNDRAFELADAVEHISLRRGSEIEAEDLLDRLDLTDAERSRVRAYRPAFAVFWLLMLLPDGPSFKRNPPGTLEEHAAYLLDLI